MSVPYCPVCIHVHAPEDSCLVAVPLSEPELILLRDGLTRLSSFKSGHKMPGRLYDRLLGATTIARNLYERERAAKADAGTL